MPTQPHVDTCREGEYLRFWARKNGLVRGAWCTRLAMFRGKATGPHVSRRYMLPRLVGMTTSSVREHCFDHPEQVSALNVAEFISPRGGSSSIGASTVPKHLLKVVEECHNVRFPALLGQSYVGPRTRVTFLSTSSRWQ